MNYVKQKIFLSIVSVVPFLTEQQCLDNKKPERLRGQFHKIFDIYFFSQKTPHKHAFANFLVFAKLFDNKFRKLRVNDYERDYAYFHNFKLLRLIKQLS